MNKLMTLKAARAIAGTLGYPSKMPGTSFGISAHACKTGRKLAKIKGSTCHGCYALKANYNYPSVAQAHAKRLAGIDNPAWSVAMATLLLAAHKNGKGRNGRFDKNWHRWFDSGDLQSVAHLAKICVVAAMTPRIRHWVPSRETGIVKAYIAAGGIVPDNVTIRISATMVDGSATAAWPTTSRVHHETLPPKGTHICPAPKQDGKCGPCRACWSKDVKHISYHKH